MVSDSVELCETEVCFLHTQLVRIEVWLPKMRNVPPEVDFASSRSPAKLESWNSHSLHSLFCSITHIKVLFVFTCVMSRVVESSCLLTQNIDPHTSFHDLPYHKIMMKKYENFEGMVISLLTRGNSRFKHGSVIVHNIFAYFPLSLSASQVYMIKGRCRFSQVDFFVE